MTNVPSKNPSFSIAFLASCLCVLGAPLSGQTPAPTAPQAVAVAEADAHAAIVKLNETKRLVAPLFGQMQLTDLRAEDCFGVRWPDGTRLMGHSSGRDYGLEFGYSGEPRQSGIAVLFVEKDVELGSKRVTAGPYFVFVSPAVATLFTEKRDGPTPVSSSVSLELAIPLDAATLEPRAPKRPRVRVTLDDRKVRIVVGDNKFDLKPAPAVR